MFTVNESRRAPAESGQALILLVLAMTVMFIIGAITVDVGLWVTERRGSQKDADFSALAGAYQLLDPNAAQSDAADAAKAALDKNNQQGNATFAPTGQDNPLVDDSCPDNRTNPPPYNAVTVDVNHQSKALFFGIFGIAQPDIGAHAKACVGAANGTGNLVPFELSNDPGPCFDSSSDPKFTSLCPIECGSQAHQCDINGQNPRGILDLDAPDDFCSNAGGSGDIEKMIEFGAPGTCLIFTRNGSCGNDPWYDCVAVQTGDTQKVIKGTNARVLKSHLCDTNFGDGDGVDDFYESVDLVFPDPGGDPRKGIYAPRDCDPTQDGLQMSPRLVTLIVLETAPDPGNAGLPIVAFAGFYIAGCADESIDVVANPDLMDPDCHDNSVRQLSPGDAGDSYVSAALPGPALDPCGGNNQETCTPTPVPTPTPTPTLVPTPTPMPTQDKNCNQGSHPTCTPTPVPTPTPTPTPTPGPPTPTPSPPPSGACGSPGHCVVYGQFVYIVLAGGGAGPPNDETTAFGLYLKD